MKNLGFTLDCHLTINEHTSNIASTCYFTLCHNISIRRFMASAATVMLVSAFSLSIVDYCSLLLFGFAHHVTSHLQCIQYYAARVILCIPKLANITSHLQLLHWLPVKATSTRKYLVCATTVTTTMHNHMSLIYCRKSHGTLTTLTPAHTGFLFSIHLHTVRHFFCFSYL